MIEPNEFKERYRSQRNKQKKIYTLKFYLLFLLLIIIAVVICTALHIKPTVCAVVGGMTGALFTSFWKTLYEDKE